MFPEDLNCAGRYCFVMTTKHPFSPTRYSLISHYCFFCLYFFLLKYIVKFNIQYKKIFTSLFPFLYTDCCTHQPLSIIHKNNKKRFSHKCKNYCLMWNGVQFWVKKWLPGNVTQSHLPTWDCILSTEPLICAAENTGSVTHDHECADYPPSKFFIKMEESSWFGLIITLWVCSHRIQCCFWALWRI